MSHSTVFPPSSNNGTKLSKITSINSSSKNLYSLIMFRSVVQRTGALNQSSFMSRNGMGAADQAPLPPAPKIDIKGDNTGMINNYMGQVFEGGKPAVIDEKKQKLLADYTG